MVYGFNELHNESTCVIHNFSNPVPKEKFHETCVIYSFEEKIKLWKFKFWVLNVNVDTDGEKAT